MAVRRPSVARLSGWSAGTTFVDGEGELVVRSGATEHLAAVSAGHERAAVTEELDEVVVDAPGRGQVGLAPGGAQNPGPVPADGALPVPLGGGRDGIDGCYDVGWASAHAPRAAIAESGRPTAAARSPPRHHGRPHRRGPPTVEPPQPPARSGFGRLTTPEAWLSTWSGLSSNADFVRCDPGSPSRPCSSSSPGTRPRSRRLPADDRRARRRRPHHRHGARATSAGPSRRANPPATNWPPPRSPPGWPSATTWRRRPGRQARRSAGGTA